MDSPHHVLPLFKITLFLLRQMGLLPLRMHSPARTGRRNVSFHHLPSPSDFPLTQLFLPEYDAALLFRRAEYRNEAVRCPPRIYKVLSPNSRRVGTTSRFWFNGVM